MRIIKNLLFITLPVLIVIIILAEMILRKFFPVSDPFERFKNRYEHLYIPSQMPAYAKYRLTSNEQFPAMDSVMTYSTNNVGFRGDSLAMPKPADETRIFIIGGSTTQCLYIDDSVSVERVLQNSLREKIPGRNIKVYSAAKSGDATAEHLAMLSQRIIHMQPDMVIIFSGINDLRKSIQKYDHMHLGAVRQYSPKYIFLAATNYQLGRRLYYLFKRPDEEELRESIPLTTNYRELFRIQQETPESDSIPYINAQPYSLNLKSIAGICAANDVTLVFVPNQSTWDSKTDTSMRTRHWLLTCGKVRYKEEYLSAGLAIFNDTMRAIAVRKNIPVFDLPAVLPASGEYFYDDCHFNKNGSVAAGKMLAGFIQAYLDLPAAGVPAMQNLNNTLKNPH